MKSFVGAATALVLINIVFTTAYGQEQPVAPTTAPSPVGGLAEVRAAIADPASKTQEKDLQAIAKKYGKDSVTLGAVGAAFLKIKRADLARPPLEAAMKLGKPSRELIYNMGVLDLRQKTNAMRSVKSIADYLVAPDRQADEPMQNLLGSLMSLAAKNKTMRGSPVFAAAVDAYTKQDQQLDALRDGTEFRWGDGWVSAMEKRAIDRQRKLLGEDLETARKRLAAAKDDRDDAERQLKRLEGSFLGGKSPPPYALKSARTAVQEAREDVSEAQDTVDEIRLKMPRPQWATAREPLLSPTPVAEQEALADGGNILLPQVPAPEPVADVMDEPAAVEAVTERPQPQQPAAKPVPARSDDERPPVGGTSIFDF